MYRLNCPKYPGHEEEGCRYCPVYTSDSYYNPYMFREMPASPLDDEFEDEIFIGQPMEMIREPRVSFTSEEAAEIAEKLGIKFDKFDLEQFRMGLDVELEHGTRDPRTNVTDDDPIMTGKIAWAHLNELPDYYTRLKKIEA